MVVFYKNYKRSDRTLLSIQSVKHLFPDLEINCLFLFDKKPSEYNDVLPQFTKLGVNIYFDKKTYNFGNPSAVGSKYNGFYFTEGVNKMHQLCLDYDIRGKVLMVDEDHFFTTGTTINYLLQHDFDLAVGKWTSPGPNRPPFEPNASIICVKPHNMVDIFPIPAREEYVEILWGWELIEKAKRLGRNIVQIPTRVEANFFGDGVHTNHIETIKEELTKHNIPYE
jgi:hypothetical protein